MAVYRHNLKQLRSRLDKDMRVGCAVTGFGKGVGEYSPGETGSTPTSESSPGYRHSSYRCPEQQEVDRSLSSPSRKIGSGGKEQVVALRDADTNLIYSARHVYAPIAQHSGGKAFIQSIPFDKENDLHARNQLPSNFERSFVDLLSGHRPAEPTFKSETKAPSTARTTSFNCSSTAAPDSARTHGTSNVTEEKEFHSPSASSVSIPETRSRLSRSNPLMIEHHTSACSANPASLPATEKANTTIGRSRRSLAEAARSSVPPLSIERCDPRRQSVKGKRTAVEVPVQSLGLTRKSLGAAQRGRPDTNRTPRRPGSTGGASVSVSPTHSARGSVSIRLGDLSPDSATASGSHRRGPARSTEQSYSSSISTLPGAPRSSPSLNASARSLRSVSRMVSSPISGLPTSARGGATSSSPRPVTRSQSCGTSSVPASPLQGSRVVRQVPASPLQTRRVARTSSPASPMQGHTPVRRSPELACRAPQSPQHMVRACGSTHVPSQAAGRATPQLSSPVRPGFPPQQLLPQQRSPAKESTPPWGHAYPGTMAAAYAASGPQFPQQHQLMPGSPMSPPLPSQANVMGGYGPPSSTGIGSSIMPGPAIDPNFLRHTFQGHLPGSAPPPIPLRPPPGGGLLASPGTPVISTAAEDHALIGQGLAWAPVRGQAPGTLGAEFKGPGNPASSPERTRSPADRSFGSSACLVPFGNASVNLPGAPGNLSSAGSIAMPMLPGNYAYPSSPPSGMRHYGPGFDTPSSPPRSREPVPRSPVPIRHYDFGAPPSPPRPAPPQTVERPAAAPRSPSRTPAHHGARQNLLPPPPPPLPQTEPDLGIHPVAGIAMPEPPVPRVGESMVCSSPQLPAIGIFSTNPNVMATTANLQESASIVVDPNLHKSMVIDPERRSQAKYSQSSEGKEHSPWLRPPFGTQHQVSNRA